MQNLWENSKKYQNCGKKFKFKEHQNCGGKVQKDTKIVWKGAKAHCSCGENAKEHQIAGTVQKDNQIGGEMLQDIIMGKSAKEHQNWGWVGCKRTLKLWAKVRKKKNT